MTFILYPNIDCSGPALQTLAKPGVPVTNGVFSAALDVEVAHFNGQALYLRLAVGGVNISCQKILHTPYALSLRPGARIGGLDAGHGNLSLYHSSGIKTIDLDAKFGDLFLGGSGIDGALSLYDGYDVSAPTIYLDGGVGVISMGKNAGSSNSIFVGDRYRDNGIIAWAKVSSGGSFGTDEFGLTSITQPAVGRYDITLNASAASAATLIPIAIAERDSQPNSAATVRIVSIDQTGPNTFSVYINNGNWAPVDNDFVFMVTAR
jgi:hypothetical protein